ncbi:MAG TPA: MOSC domain-containing protein [Smithellaceae bacterium]|nr:MOSC domain-containing protein [Smithellaceae bacterium]HRS88938.1 MOSC domain-containing protein [Smithellaceae bacterium]HRV25554.1 MOSC domain-containing protein [Smithellaceae bacterium]
MAKIISVNISNNKGEKKHDIGRCRVLRHAGLENDAHGEDETRQISLLAAESIEKIRQKGLPVNYGDFAENITTQGLILHTLPLGTKLKIGSEVVLEVTQIGKSCLKPCAIYFTVGDCVMPKEGIFARVLTEGVIASGDEIRILSQTTSS